MKRQFAFCTKCGRIVSRQSDDAPWTHSASDPETREIASDINRVDSLARIVEVRQTVHRADPAHSRPAYVDVHAIVLEDGTELQPFHADTLNPAVDFFIVSARKAALARMLTAKAEGGAR